MTFIDHCQTCALCANAEGIEELCEEGREIVEGNLREGVGM